jgi:predicted metal-dependent enzyme (double-stranded beta helix superfamily)
MAFELEGFLVQCRTVIAGGDAEKAMRELVARTVAAPSELTAALPAPAHAGFTVLHRAADLTVLDFAWAPWMSFKPHNHCMWSAVGIYAGREDNVFWRRTPDRIEAAGARSLGAGDATLLGSDIIHSVVNPIGKWTRAIHVYGGDFFAPPAERSEWDHESLCARPWNLDDTKRMFAEAEARAQSAPR